MSFLAKLAISSILEWAGVSLIQCREESLTVMCEGTSGRLGQKRLDSKGMIWFPGGWYSPVLVQ